MRPEHSATPLALCLALAVHGAVFFFLGYVLVDRARETLAPTLIIGIEFAETEIPSSEPEPYLAMPEIEVGGEAEDPLPVLASPEPEPEAIITISESDFTPHIPEPEPEPEDWSRETLAPTLPEIEPFVPEPAASIIQPSAISHQPSPPAARNQIRPSYPIGARRRGEEGTVIHEIAITEKGVVSDAALIKSSGFPELDNAARKALLAARFTPATRDGAPIPFRMLLPIEFNIVGP